jgi:dienelactone hydrolase
MNARPTAILVILGLTLLSPSAIRSAAPQEAPVPPSLAESLVPLARQFMEALRAGDFQAAAKDFDPTMLKVSGPDKLAAFWKTFQPQVGTLKAMPEFRSERTGPYDIILLTCEFEKTKLLARVVFDANRKIAGFGFVPYYPPAKYEPPAYADPKLFEEVEVTVGTGEWKLPGTLTLPKGAGPFPGLVLVHGSGPNDRNESIGPNRPFQDLAWGLASRGIAVLRYDKRTKVYAERYKSDPALLASLTVKEETIDDALAAARLLLANPKIDRRRVFILGHSLGGMLIPRIALAARPLDLAGFIIMAGLTRPLDETIVQQMTYLLNLGGPSEESRKKLEEYKALMAKVKALKESDRGSKEIILGGAPAYWLDMRGYDPPDVAKEVKKPMLILQGGRDYQVTTEDFENWKKALSGRPDVTFKFYPKANHLFFEGQGQITPNEYQYVHGSVALAVVNDIADWIQRTPPAGR